MVAPRVQSVCKRKEDRARARERERERERDGENASGRNVRVKSIFIHLGIHVCRFRLRGFGCVCAWSVGGVVTVLFGPSVVVVIINLVGGQDRDRLHDRS